MYVTVCGMDYEWDLKNITLPIPILVINDCLWYLTYNIEACALVTFDVLIR